jgi:nitrite reductase (NADH) small subunit
MHKSSTAELEEIRACEVEDVPPQEGRMITVHGRPIAVFRAASGWFALDNTCTHQGGPLANGILSDESVACPLHDRRFELSTGRPLDHDCGAVASYPVEVRDGTVFVGVPVVRTDDGSGAR